MASPAATRRSARAHRPAGFGVVANPVRAGDGRRFAGFGPPIRPPATPARWRPAAARGPRAGRSGRVKGTAWRGRGWSEAGSASSFGLSAHAVVVQVRVPHGLDVFGGEAGEQRHDAPFPRAVPAAAQAPDGAGQALLQRVVVRAHDLGAHNDALQQRLAGSVWSLCRSWYRTQEAHRGAVSGFTAEYVKAVRQPNLNDYRMG